MASLIEVAIAVSAVCLATTTATPASLDAKEMSLLEKELEGLDAGGQGKPASESYLAL